MRAYKKYTRIKNKIAKKKVLNGNNFDGLNVCCFIYIIHQEYSVSIRSFLTFFSLKQKHSVRNTHYQIARLSQVTTLKSHIYFES